MKGTHLGEFEELVLLCVCNLSDGAYGLAIRRLLGEEVGRSASIGAIYAALERLEGKGYVTSQMSDPTAVRGGRRKRLYQPTSAGLETLIAQRQMRTQLWQGLGHLGLADGGRA